MAWPLSQDYNEAVQTPESTFSDPELRGGQAVTNALGMPMPRSGNFADVYEFVGASGAKWAVKCFTRETPGLLDRYHEIDLHLLKVKLPFSVEFQCHPRGVLIRGQWYPILKMQWVEGFLLNEFVRDNLDKPAVLDGLGQIWTRMGKRLREADMAHADLQHGNIILVPGSKSGSLAVKLIDYDGMYVPALAKIKSGEVGHPNYQHPQRLREGLYNIHVDRFPLLVVATALRGLVVGGRSLWDRHDNGDNLLFRETDLQAPQKSELFKELLDMSDPQLRTLAEELRKAATLKLEDARTLDDISPEKKKTTGLHPGPAPLAKPPKKPAEAVVIAPVAERGDFASLDDGEPVGTKARGKTKGKSGGVPMWAILAGGGFAALLLLALVGGGIAWFLLSGPNKGGDPVAKKTDTPPGNDGKKGLKKTDKVANVPPEKDNGNPPVTPDGFVSLFNGKNLTGWMDQDGKWRVADGVLGRAVDNGVLFSARDDYKNFHLRVEARLNQDLAMGVLFRCTVDSLGYECAIGKKATSRLAVKTMSADGVAKFLRVLQGAPPTPLPALGQWFVLEIIAEGNRMKVNLNGVTTADSIDIQQTFKAGRIGLRGSRESIEYRRVEIKELPDSPNITPPPPSTFVALFNGKDITGWKWKPPQDANDWPVVNNILSPAGRSAGNLYTLRDDYRDFHLRVEARYNGGNSGAAIAFRTPYDETGYEISIPDNANVAGRLAYRTKDDVKTLPGSPVALAAGEWFMVEAVVRGDSFVIAVNGKTTAIVKHTEGYTSGHIAVRQQPNSAIEFRKIEIKELSAPALPPPPLGGFTSLFNSKNLAGWMWKSDQNPQDWQVVDGILTCSAGNFSRLYTARPNYKDFHLRVEARYADGKAPHYLGFRTQKDRVGYQVLINDPTPSGTGALMARTKESSKILNGAEKQTQPGEWFNLEVIAIGNQLAVIVNGKPTTNQALRDDAFSSGHILLCCGKTGTIEFRKIEIKEVTNAAPPDVPAVAIELPNGNGKAGASSVLTQTDALYMLKRHKLFLYPAEEGNTYQIDMKSTAFDSYLYLEDPSGKLVTQDDDGGGFPNARITFKAAQTGKYRIIATCFVQQQQSFGKFTLTINQQEVAKVDPPKKVDPPPVKTVRIAVPDPDKVKEAEKAIREQYKADYAKKTSADLAALAEKLQRVADDADDPAERYALLHEARDLAVKAGRVELAMKAVTDMCDKYLIDEPAARVEAIGLFAKMTLGAEAAKQLIETAVTHAASALAEDNVDPAVKILTTAESVARASSSGSVHAQVKKQLEQAKDIAKDHAEMVKAQAKLMEAAEDAEANLTVGLYLAFRKGNWEKGLPMLAQGSSPDLQQLAKKDLDAPADDKAKIELGDAWWSGADKKPASSKAAMQWRAAYWYRQALPNLKGIAEDKVSGRLKQVDAQPSPFRVLSVGEVGRFKGGAGAVNCLSLSKDGKRLFSGNADGTVRAFELATHKQRVVLPFPFTKSSVAYCALSPDETRVVWLDPVGKTSLTDLTALKPSKGGTRNSVPGFFWVNDSSVAYVFETTWMNWTVSGGGNGGPIIFDNNIKQGRNVRALVVAPEQDSGAILCGDEVITFKIRNSNLRVPNAKIRFDAITAVFPKDSAFVVLGGKEGRLRAYRMPANPTEEPQQLSAFKGHTGAILAVACTPDGKKIISGSDDKTMRIWDTNTGEQLQRFQHPGPVTSLVVTPDGRYAISGCADSIIRIWSLAN